MDFLMNTLPVEEVPPELPEPALGINFARDGMQVTDWLVLVAVHSDAWLVSVAHYFGARFGFDKTDRRLLFGLINDLPTVCEIVTGIAKRQICEIVTGIAKRQTKEKSSVSNHSSNKSKLNAKSRAKDEEEEHGDTLCGACEENYAEDEFWICCDIM